MLPPSPEHQGREGHLVSSVSWSASFFILLLLISGCIEKVADHKREDSDELRYQEPLIFPVAVPIIINETEDPTGFWLDWNRNPECSFEALRSFQYHKLLDRYGVVNEEVVRLTDAPAQRLWVPVKGDPPWVFVGDKNPCMSIWNSQLDGVTRGQKMADDKGAWGEKRFTDYVTLTIPKGGRNASATWSGTGENFTGTFGGIPLVHEGRGLFKGRIEMYYPDGVLWRWDRIDLGHREAYFEPLQYMPGEYRIEAKADAAVVDDLVIEYVIHYYRLDHRACMHDIEWRMCEGLKPWSPSDR